jgi:hypothetical protein
MLRRIFGPKRDEVIGGGRTLHSEELHYLYSSPSIIRIVKEDEMGIACSTNVNSTAYRILVAKPVGKRPLGRSRLMW